MNFKQYVNVIYPVHYRQAFITTKLLQQTGSEETILSNSVVLMMRFLMGLEESLTDFKLELRVEASSASTGPQIIYTYIRVETFHSIAG